MPEKMCCLCRENRRKTGISAIYNRQIIRIDKTAIKSDKTDIAISDKSVQIVYMYPELTGEPLLVPVQVFKSSVKIVF